MLRFPPVRSRVGLGEHVLNVQFVEIICEKIRIWICQIQLRMGNRNFKFYMVIYLNIEIITE